MTKWFVHSKSVSASLPISFRVKIALAKVSMSFLKLSYDAFERISCNLYYALTCSEYVYPRMLLVGTLISS